MVPAGRNASQRVWPPQRPQSVSTSYNEVGAQVPRRPEERTAGSLTADGIRHRENYSHACMHARLLLLFLVTGH